MRILLAAVTLLSASVLAQEPAGVGWTTLEPQAVGSACGAKLTVLSDGSIVASGANPAKDTYTVEVETNLVGITAIRLEALVPAKGKPLGRSRSGNIVVSEVSATYSSRITRDTRKLVLRYATASFNQDHHAVTRAIDGAANTGWAVSPRQKKPQIAVFETLEPFGFRNGTKIVFEIAQLFGDQHTMARFRLSATTAAKPPLAPVDPTRWHGLQTKVNNAIARGVDFLVRQQRLDGSWAGHQDTYRNGQTALSLYALLKSGVSSKHQSVRRAVAFLRSGTPRRTYETACQILALLALDDRSHEEWIQELVDRLAGWEKGGYSYPKGAIDLSNTQYGALGLWAASKHGYKVSDKLWSHIADRTLRHQEQTREAYGPAGFGYRIGSNATGSMTAAGVSVLAICEERLHAARRRTKEYAGPKKRGIEWLARHFTPSGNPPFRGAHAWLYYYLYGVERVGGLTGLELLGNHDWYREGADYLVRVQGKDGSWAVGRGGKEHNTAFALLFLSRATSPTTGGTVAKGAYGGDDPDAPVSIRASGDTPLGMWISSFGKQAIAECTWPGEEGKGLHVERVSYHLPEQSLLRHTPGDPVIWRMTKKRPRRTWFEPDFDDRRWETAPAAFGLPGSRLPVGTPWTGDEIWIRKRFRVQPGQLMHPILLLHHSNQLPKPVSNEPDGPPVVCLYDEDYTFPGLLTGANGASEVIEQNADSFSGQRALRVIGVQRFNPKIPGWSFRVTENPKGGEFRYLRFAWKKVGAGGIMLQLAVNGKWDKAMRYFAGTNDADWKPAKRVDARAPASWKVVTRDLFKDFGRPVNITGIALTPMVGEAGLFDSIYLAKHVEDFQQVERGRAKRPAVERRGKLDEPPAVEVYLNGELIHATDASSAGYVPILADEELRKALVDGDNVIAARCRKSGEVQYLDLDLRDQTLIGVADGDPSKPCGKALFPARYSFARPGEYDITASVYVRVPAKDGEGSVRRILRSNPLHVRIDEVFDPELASYGSDPARNLIPRKRVEITASSVLDAKKWKPRFAIDNSQLKAWLSKDGDPMPTLDIELPRPVRANTLLLSHPFGGSEDGPRRTRAHRVEVRINGERKPRSVVMIADDMRKTVLEFRRPVRVRNIQLRIVSRRSATPGRDAVGFGEVELQLRKR